MLKAFDTQSRHNIFLNQINRSIVTDSKNGLNNQLITRAANEVIELAIVEHRGKCPFCFLNHHSSVIAAISSITTLLT